MNWKRACRRWILPLWLRGFLAGCLSCSFIFSLFLGMRDSVERSDDLANKYRDQRNKKISSQQFKIHLPSMAARRNVIIVSHGRSGSSITGDIFNHHPDVFYLYEPLQTVQRTQQKFNVGYKGLAEIFLTKILRCSFDEPVFLEDIEWYYRRPVHPRISQAIGSPPLCPYNLSDEKWDYKKCSRMTSKSLGKACKNHYQLTVIKILLSRIPQNSLQSIISACNSEDIDCKIVFLVRDPRAVIPSSLSVRFYEEQGGVGKLGTRKFSYDLCKITEENLYFLRHLPDWLRSRIMLLRYEDLANKPLKQMRRLYKFAGLSVIESVADWLNRVTHPSKSRDEIKITGSQAAFTVDDAQAAINRWRWKVHPHEIAIIEKYCKNVIKLMGYTLLHNSFELQSNISIPLYSQDYEAKDWFQD